MSPKGTEHSSAAAAHITHRGRQDWSLDYGTPATFSFFTCELTDLHKQPLSDLFLCRLKGYWVSACKLAFGPGLRFFLDKLRIKQKSTWIQMLPKLVTSLVESPRSKTLFMS